MAKHSCRILSYGIINHYAVFWRLERDFLGRTSSLAGTWNNTPPRLSRLAAFGLNGHLIWRATPLWFLISLSGVAWFVVVYWKKVFPVSPNRKYRKVQKAICKSILVTTKPLSQHFTLEYNTIYQTYIHIYIRCVSHSATNQPLFSWEISMWERFVRHGWFWVRFFSLVRRWQNWAVKQTLFTTLLYIHWKIASKTKVEV